MFNRFILSIVTGLYCTTFFVSNNWYIYSFYQNLVLILFGTVICSSILLILSLFFSFLLNKIFSMLGKNFQSDHARDILMLVLSIILCLILLRNTIASLPVSPIILFLTLIVATYFTRQFITNSLLKKINIIFFILICFSLSKLAFAYSDARTKSTEENPLSKWTTQEKEFNDQIRFTKKPNVYFIITESYPNKEALEKIYNFDNQHFYVELNNRGFSTQHDFFSNYNHTLASLPSLFAMRHHYYYINLGNFDSIGGREMLEAKSYNPVIDIFRQNNYQIQYILSEDGLFPEGAEVDYFSPQPPVYLALETFFTHQDTTKKSIFGSNNYNFLETLQKRLSDISLSSKPSFTFIYTNSPHHSPSRWKTKDKDKINRILEEFRANYGEKIHKANIHLLKLIDIILRNDNDPIIIVAGDHGPWGYRLKMDGSGKIIPDSLFALDRFGVLMSIHFPKDYQKNLTSLLKTHVNLFRYVFTYLSDNNQIIENKVEDDSFDYGPSLVIQNGKILESYIPIEVRLK